MAIYGSGDDETIITEYLNAHLENGIKQKNLDFILDLIDLYVDLIESISWERSARHEWLLLLLLSISIK